MYNYLYYLLLQWLLLLLVNLVQSNEINHDLIIANLISNRLLSSRSNCMLIFEGLLILEFGLGIVLFSSPILRSFLTFISMILYKSLTMSYQHIAPSYSVVKIPTPSTAYNSASNFTSTFIFPTHNSSTSLPTLNIYYI